jgi:hypothetical protein
MRLRVRTRLYAGFGVLILLGIGIAGFSIIQLRAVVDEVTVISASADDAARLGQALISLEQTRTLAGRFYAEEAQTSAQAVRDSLAGTVDLLRQVAAVSSGDQQPTLQTVRQEVAALGDDFEKLITLADESKAQHARQMVLGEELTRAMKRLRQLGKTSSPAIADAVADVEQAIYDARVDILHFVVTGQPKEGAPIDADRDAIGHAQE